MHRTNILRGVNRNLRITVNQGWTEGLLHSKRANHCRAEESLEEIFTPRTRRKTLPFRVGYIEVARLPDDDHFRRPHTLPSSPRRFDGATLSALPVRALQDRNRACKRLSSNAPLRKYADRPSPPRKPESKRESCLC